MILRTASLLLAVALVCPPPGRAASVRTVVKAGDGTPVGGIFAGPSFTGWPAAAGSGWVAFRSALEAGASAEAIVAARFTDPQTRVQIARLGQLIPGAGTIRQFLGRPAINAAGNVAFLATYRPDGGSDRNGIFLFDHNAASGEPVSRIVDHGDTVTVPGLVGVTLDLNTPAEAGATPSDDDTPVRGPGLNDGDTIAFLAALDGATAGTTALFTLGPGGTPSVVAWTGTPAPGGGTFTAFGTPAINNAAEVAFRATVTDDGDGDGIFFATSGTLRRRVSRGIVPDAAGSPAPIAQPLQQFGNALSLNDLGDIGFVGGPLVVDPADPPAVGADPEFGALVALNDLGGSVTLVGYPRESDLSVGQVTGISLSLAAANLPVPPVVNADRSVVYFVSVEGGAREAIARKGPPGFTKRDVLVVFGRDTPNEPSGGVYRSCESAMAVDATGAIAFSARAAGGAAGEILAYQAGTASASAQYIAQAEAAPANGSGYFGGPPFSGAHVLDDGDVVFKAFVARGQTSVGIFRSHFDAGPDGRLVATTTKLVGANDPSPLGFGTSAERFIDIVGDPDVNGVGAVAFAARVENEGRGIYGITPDGAVTLVARRGDPGPTGGAFTTLGKAPSINADGVIAFQGTVRFDDGNGTSHSMTGLFLAPPGTAPQLVAFVGEDSTVGKFFKLRDPAVSRVPSLAFRASLGDVSELAQGVFLASPGSVQPLAVSGQVLGDGVVLASFSGSPSASDGGDAAFVAAQQQNGVALGTALFRYGTNGLERVVATGGAGPAGGAWASLSAPTMTPSGHIVFRGAFAPGSGGTGGLFRVTDAGVKPYVLANDVTPIGGRFSAFGTTLGLNGQDDLALTATVSGASVRNGVFVASQTVLQAQQWAVQLSGGRKRDRATLAMTLTLGRIAVDADLDPSHKVIYVTLGHGGGPLASIRIAPGALRRQGNKWIARSKPPELRSFRLAVGRKRTYRVRLQTANLDLTSGGTVPLKAPLSVGLQVGDDGGVAIGRCTIRPRTIRCST